MPIQCEYYAMEGLTQMIHVIRDVMQRKTNRFARRGRLTGRCCECSPRSAPPFRH
ncbi:MAG: hypothetical protein WCK15_13820 [Pirellula sp.]